MIDVAEAIDVALTLVGALFVWVVAAGMGLTVLLLLSAWAVTSGTRAVWRGLTGAWRHSQGSGGAMEPREAHGPSEGPQKDFNYQEAA